LIKHILYYLPAKILPGAINFLGLMIYARIFTQSEYGRFSYVIALFALMQSILFPWIRMSTNRYYQRYMKTGKGKEFQNFALFIFALSSIILTLLVVIYLSTVDVEQDLIHLFILALFVVILQSLFEQLMSFARAKLDSRTFAYSSIIRAILRLSTTLLLVVFLEIKEEALFIGLIVAQLIPITIYIRKHFEFDIKLFRFNLKYFKNMLSYGGPLTVTFLLGFIINTSDRILIKYFLDEKSVGLYSLPYEFTDYTIRNIFTVFSLAFFPVIVKELEQDNVSRMNYRIKQYGEIMLSFTLPCIIFILIFSPFIVTLFLGENYESPETNMIIQIISLSVFVAGLKAYYFDYSFQLGESTKSQVIPVVLAATVNIILNILLIPYKGVIGAVFATLTAYLIGLLTSILVGRRIFYITLFSKNTFSILLANIIFLTGIIKLSRLSINWYNFIVIAVISFLFYVVLIYSFNIAQIRHIIKKKLDNLGVRK